MMKEVLLEGLPKKVDEGVIQTWFYEEGDRVSENEDLVEIICPEGTYVIQAAASGLLAEVYYDEGDTVSRGEVLCMIDDEEPVEEGSEEEEDKGKEEDDDDDDSGYDEDDEDK